MHVRASMIYISPLRGLLAPQVSPTSLLPRLSKYIGLISLRRMVGWMDGCCKKVEEEEERGVCTVLGGG